MNKKCMIILAMMTLCTGMVEASGRSDYSFKREKAIRNEMDSLERRGAVLQNIDLCDRGLEEDEKQEELNIDARLRLLSEELNQEKEKFPEAYRRDLYTKSGLTAAAFTALALLADSKKIVPIVGASLVTAGIAAYNNPNKMAGVLLQAKIDLLG